MKKDLLAVARDRNFVNSVPPKSAQSEFFYFEYTINGTKLLPLDMLIVDIDSFFLGKMVCNTREYEVFRNFVLYADGLASDEFSRVLDEQLGVIVEMLSPSYIAADMMVANVSNRLLAASSLIDALGDLGRLKADTQGLISDGLSKAIREAKKAALVMS